MNALRLAAALLVSALIPACTPSTPAGSPSTSPTPPARVVLVTHDSFAVSDSVWDELERDAGITVEVLKGGDAGSVVNQAILTKDAPLGDVLFGIDNTFLSRALAEDIFEPYQPAGAEALPDALRLDDSGRVTAVDYGDVCVNYDRAAFSNDATTPSALEDLADPQHRGQLVVQNPATSSPGLAFMLATIVRFGESGSYTWLDYWADLIENEVLVVSGWEEAYYTHFSGGAGEGDRPLVVSYATSPVAEVVFADPQPSEAPTAALNDGCFRQVEFAGILRGTDDVAAAQRLIDFLLTREFQADIPLNMFVFPAVPDVDLPDVFEEHATVVDEPLTMDPAQIAANRERWLEEWTDVVLR